MSDAPAKAPSSWRAALLGAVLGGVATAAVIGAAGYNNRERLRAWLLAGDEARLTAVEAKQADLTTQLDQVAEKAAAQTLPDTAKLEGEIADLKRTQPSEGLILRLTDRVEAAERAARELSDAQAASQALLLTLGQLRDAVDRGDGFTAELAAARRLVQGDEKAQLDSFADGADNGIPRRDQLLKSFKPLSEALLQKEADLSGPGWWNAVMSHVRKVISLRRMDGKGNDAEAVLARTEAAFKDDDWDQAVEDMRALPGPYEELAGDWLRQARLRLAADRALSALSASAAARTTPRQP